ncbi:H(+)/Cl(-) exchange transporter ClcA [Methylomonas fluvii]|uniref:H(+)/Cl(-) exchange transporter ClcA n=1 Tax=Methylomonas fluvii TaxID=1854564 RepID=A0ABR9DBU1_9GAMM|nr:H(+)/Cl(-) exchange transporter ClcA [Methylomonas fluvii]MBD9360573.1 H(+)/Cl(-) exchange transporter ClcA [Methylomonas fluvii]CAD6873409.1 Voltage-gated H(+)/2Cl(-) exchange transporter ClcA [Methylomonas fluvii]
MKCDLSEHQPASAAELNRQRNRLIPQAIVLGLLTGGTSVVFHFAMNSAEACRHKFLAFSHQNSHLGMCMVLGLALVTVSISAGLVRQFAPESSGSGIPHIKGVLIGHRHFRWVRVLLTKFFSMVIGSVGGLVVGRAGPCVHMGSSIGQGLADIWPKNDKRYHTILIAAGGGAGLTAAFNAPLSGLTFVLEELERRCSSLEFITAAIACLTADMVCRVALGQQSVFHFAHVAAAPLSQLIAFVPLGLLSALLGGLFTRTLLWGQRLITLGPWSRSIWWLILAGGLTATAWYAPQLLGGGHDFVNDILVGQELTLQTIGLFFISRFVLTIGSSCSGAAGGIFMPILVLGALLGWGVGVSTQLAFPGLNVDPRLFAVVGMAAYFSGVVQAPLTGIVLIIEMTGDYALILPLFTACFTALLIANWLGCPPVYEALLENDLRKERIQ